MKPRVFHLTDFPAEKIYLNLDKEIRKDIFSESMELFKTRKNLASFLGVRKLDTISRWRDGHIKRSSQIKTKQFLPLSVLLKLLETLPADAQSSFSIKAIEESVNAYKAPGDGAKIENPCLPIKEKPEIASLIAHLIADGYAGKMNTQYYRNTNNGCLDDFEANLKIFGDVPTVRYADKITFPIVVSHILRHIYKVNFGTYDARIPPEFLDLNDEFASSLLGAFFDDESHLDDTRIIAYSANRGLLEDIRYLLIHKFPEIEPVSNVIKRSRAGSNVLYEFRILSRGLHPYKMHINFTHTKKLRRINFILSKRKRHWNNRPKMATKKLILNSLRYGSKTAKAISEDVFIGSSKVTDHLNGYKKRGKRIPGLEDLKYVKKIGKRGNSYLWHLTAQGRDYINHGKNVQD